MFTGLYFILTNVFINKLKRNHVYQDETYASLATFLIPSATIDITVSLITFMHMITYD